MNCHHCAETVNKALINCCGVLQARVSLEKDEVDLQIEETLFNVEDLRIALRAAGQYKLIS